MASSELSRRVGKVVGYPPLSEMDERQRREFHEAPLEAGTFEDLYNARSASGNKRGLAEGAPQPRRSVEASGDSGRASRISDSGISIGARSALLPIPFAMSIRTG
jgi:hypothetical protein